MNLPPLVGTLDDLPDHVKSCIEAYGKAAQAKAVAAKDAQIAKLEAEINRLQAAMHRGMQAKAVAAAVPEVPEGFNLVAVKNFDDLMYWLARCEDKGHLENCADLIEPWEAFEYRYIAASPEVKHSVAAAVPEGYKLVPIEPTKEMVETGRRYFKDTWNDIFTTSEHYRLMIAAAPEVKP
jgi:uncharacterized small protein (DUF1192 family)